MLLPLKTFWAPQVLHEAEFCQGLRACGWQEGQEDFLWDAFCHDGTALCPKHIRWGTWAFLGGIGT